MLALYDGERHHHLVDMLNHDPKTQGKRKDARDLLKPVYGWFPEDFDTKDLIEAKSLLGELAA